MAMEITRDGELLLRLPRSMSDRAARQLVLRHLPRILQRLEQVRTRPKPEPLSRERVQALAASAREMLPPMVDVWAAKLGVVPTGVRITSAQKRFGSCSSRGRLCFSYMLMLYPPDAIEYVVLHEVAHLVHLHHGPAFYALVAQHMPDHAMRRQLLRQLPPKEDAV